VELDQDAVCHRFYSNCTAIVLPSRPLNDFGDFKEEGQGIRTVKQADNLVLPTKEETVLQGVIEILNKIGR